MIACLCPCTTFRGTTGRWLFERQYAMQENPIPDAGRRAALNAFYFWASWSTVTNRPGEDVTYTSNWPSEPLVGNTPTTPTFIWTFVSILFLLGGIGALAWY